MPARAMPCTMRSMRRRCSTACARVASMRCTSPALPVIAAAISSAPISAAGSTRARATALDSCARGHDLVLVAGRRLVGARRAASRLPLLDAALPALRQQAWRLGPAVVVEQGRVAIGDEIGAALEAAMVAVLIGERPGLTSPDSLGVYLTWAPAIGRQDAERNCLSNIRPDGMGYAEAAAKLVYLLAAARSCASPASR